jgi:hypothetical protein
MINFFQNNSNDFFNFDNFDNVVQNSTVANNQSSTSFQLDFSEIGDVVVDSVVKYYGLEEYQPLISDVTHIVASPEFQKLATSIEGYFNPDFAA